MAPHPRFETRPLGIAGIGREVLGLDLSHPLDEATRRALIEAWLEAGLLLFRGAVRSDAEHVRLSRCFGELEVHPVESIRVEGHPELIRLSNLAGEDAIVHYFDGRPLAGHIPWHSDLVYTPRPCRGALLRMVEKPAIGGETAWCDTAAAWAALAPELQRHIEGLEARFELVTDICDMRFGRPERLRHGTMGSQVFGSFPPVAHPLVWRHPVTGRKALMVSPLHLIEMVGMPRAEGDALLRELVEHVMQPRFAYVHDWQVDDVVLWDNWRTMHTALGTPPEHARCVKRTSLLGDRELGRLL